jgi:tetratricopeptide (TPR) repeat protein
MRRDIVISVLLVVATAVVYGPAARHDFINLDDPGYVTGNGNVQNGLTVESLGWALTAIQEANWHPLTWLSHMVDWQLFGPWAGGHHLMSVALHAASAVLLFWLLRRMTAAAWPSAFVAALFALHPLHVESVAWVAERKDVLSTLLGFLALLFYVRYAARPSLARYVPVFVFLALGLMAKPMLVTLPFVMLLLDYWPLGRYPLRIANCELRIQTAPARGLFKSAIRDPQSVNSFGRTSALPARHNLGSGGRLVLEKLPLFALVAASCVITFIAQHRGGAMRLTENLDFSQRLANALVVYVVYAGRMAWPADMAVFYPYAVRPPSQAVLAAILLVTVTVLVLWHLRRRPYLAVGWFWYLGTLVPVIGLVQVGGQAMADRFTYLPLVGLFIAVAWGAAEWASGRRWRAWGVAAGAVLVVIACMAASARQLQYWTDSETLDRHALSVTEDNVMIHDNLGVCLFSMGRYEESAEEHEAALRIDPGYVGAHNNLGLALVKLGRLDDAKRHYNEALRLKPDYATGYVNLGLALAKVGRFEEAIQHYHEALRLAPDLGPAHDHLGSSLLSQGKREEALAEFEEALRLNPRDGAAHNNLAIALGQSGRTDEAISHLRESLRLNPRDAGAHNNLGFALGQLGRTQEEIAEYGEAIRLSPKYASPRYNLGITLVRQGHGEEALDQFREVLRLDPGQAGAHNQIARILATAPGAALRNGPQAVAMAERLCNGTGRKAPEFLDTLAAAYAEVGRFDDAARTAREALGLAQSLGRKDLAGPMEARLRLYEAGQPFHEKP